MPRRVNLPGADELFRPTAREGTAGAAPARPPREPLPKPPGSTSESRPESRQNESWQPEARQPEPRHVEPRHRDSARPPIAPAARLQAVHDVPAPESGRVKHDEKMTIYVTADELLSVEQARLQLRAALGRTVDRGRFVRAAVALALADLEEHGIESAVARRLSDT